MLPRFTAGDSAKFPLAQDINVWYTRSRRESLGHRLDIELRIEPDESRMAGL